MDLTQLLDAQGEAAYQAWTKRWGESGLKQDYVNVNYEDSDPASIANPFRWNIMDNAQFLHPPEDGITHLRVVTSAQHLRRPRLLDDLIPSLGTHCTRMRHVSWEGLLTARSLSLLAEHGPGLETVDLSAAYPVDATTLDALRSSLGHRVDRVQHMHLDLRWALDDRELEERVALDIVRSLRLFPNLRTLHLYHADHGPAPAVCHALSQVSSLRCVTLYSSVRERMPALSSLWRVESTRQNLEEYKADDDEVEAEAGDTPGKVRTRSLYSHQHTRHWDGSSRALKSLKPHPFVIRQ